MGAPLTQAPRKCFRIDRPLVPTSLARFESFHGLGEWWAAYLLDLVDRECQDHQHCKDRREVLGAVPEVMDQMVALLLERVEDLILDFPSRSSTSDEFGYDMLGKP